MKNITVFAVLLFSFQLWAQQMPGGGGMNGANTGSGMNGGSGMNTGSGMNGDSGNDSGQVSGFVTYEMKQQACAQFFPSNLSYQNTCVQQYSFSIVSDSQYIATLSWSGYIGGNQIQTCTVSVLKSPNPNAKFALPPVSCQIYSNQPKPHW